MVQKLKISETASIYFSSMVFYTESGDLCHFLRLLYFFFLSKLYMWVENNQKHHKFREMLKQTSARIRRNGQVFHTMEKLYLKLVTSVPIKWLEARQTMHENSNTNTPSLILLPITPITEECSPHENLSHLAFKFNRQPKSVLLSGGP